MRACGCTAALAAGAAAALLVGGCFSPESLLNPDFLTALGGGAKVATLPGDAPALLVAVENRTSHLVEAVLSYRTQDAGVQTLTSTVAEGAKTAQALICPIEELTLGDVTNATTVGVRVRLGNGTADDPYLEVEPFGVVMRVGINYDCGDGITFVVRPSTATSSGYQIFAFIQRSGG